MFLANMELKGAQFLFFLKNIYIFVLGTEDKNMTQGLIKFIIFIQ